MTAIARMHESCKLSMRTKRNVWAAWALFAVLWSIAGAVSSCLQTCGPRVLLLVSFHGIRTRYGGHPDLARKSHRRADPMRIPRAMAERLCISLQIGVKVSRFCTVNGNASSRIWKISALISANPKYTPTDWDRKIPNHTVQVYPKLQVISRDSPESILLPYNVKKLETIYVDSAFSMAWSPRYNSSADYVCPNLREKYSQTKFYKRIFHLPVAGYLHVKLAIANVGKAYATLATKDQIAPNLQCPPQHPFLCIYGHRNCHNSSVVAAWRAIIIGRCGLTPYWHHTHMPAWSVIITVPVAPKHSC